MICNPSTGSRRRCTLNTSMMDWRTSKRHLDAPVLANRRRDRVAQSTSIRHQYIQIVALK